MNVWRSARTAAAGRGRKRPLSALLTLALVSFGLVVVTQVHPDQANAAPSAGLAPGGVTGNLGSFGSGVNIEVPPFHGIEPDVSLTYNSSMGNGLAGVGWKLSVESFVERVSPGRGAPTWTASDGYLLDGEELVASTALGGTHVTKRQSFLRIKFDSTADTWTVWAKDGTKTVYGGRHTVSAGTFRWLRSQVVDTYGNTVNYNYWCDPGNYCYVNTITYNGATITLYRESRPDPVSFAAGGSRALVNYRIKTIDVKVGSARARAYKLTYATSGPTGRSLLASVQQFGSDANLDTSGTITGGSKLPAVSMTYQGDTSPASFTTSEVTELLNGDPSPWPYCRGASVRFGVADFDSDGKEDLWCHDPDEGSTDSALFTGASTVTVSYNWDLYEWCDGSLTIPAESYLGDFNGDGYKDLWCDHMWPNIAFANGNGGFNSPVKWLYSFCSVSSYQRGMGDFDGDGKDDLWCHTPSGATAVAISVGNGQFTVKPTLTGWCANQSFGVADFNGDGRMDLWCHNDSNGDTWVAHSKGDGSFTTFAKSMTWCTAGAPYGFGTFDYNGDAKADFWCHSNTSGDTWVATSNGNGSFTTYGVSKTGWCYGASTLSFGMADFNGDGRSDAWCHNSANGDTWVMFASGLSGFTSFAKSMTWCTFAPPDGFGVGDVNGDGKADFLCHSKAAGDTWIATVGSVLGRTDLLTKQTTGAGGEQRIAYKPASSYNNVLLPGRMPMVVSSITVDDGRGTVSTTNYSYSGGRFDLVEGRFLGYEKVTATEPSGASSVTTFKQTAGHASGRVTQVDRKASNGRLLEQQKNTYSESASGGVYLSQLTSAVRSICGDYSGTNYCQSSRTDYSYDSYGNANLVKQYGDTAVSGDERTVSTTFTYATTPYIVNTPSLVKTHSGLGTGGTVGKQTKYTYNSSGDPLTVQEWLNTTNTWLVSKLTYDSYGNVATSSNPLDAAASKNTATYTYDPTYHQYLVSSCDVLNHCSTQTWNTVLSRATSSKNVNNRVTSWTYDALGRQIIEMRPDGSWTTHGWVNLGNAGTQFEEVMTSDGTSGGMWSRTYTDGLGRVWKQVGEPNITTLTKYNTQGQVSQVSHPHRTGEAVKWTSFAYDGLGRQTTVTNPDGSTRQTTYGWDNRPSSSGKFWTKDCDEMGTCVAAVYNGYGQPLITADKASGIDYRSNLKYDAWGQLIEVTDAVGAKTTMTYDSLGRRLTLNDPDSGAWSYTYDNNSRLASQTDARGKTITSTYDAVGRLKTETSGGVTLATYNYDQTGHGDGIGRRTSVTDSSGSTSWTFDNMGRTTKVVKAIGGIGYTVSQTYDLAGRTKSLTYPGGEVVNYTYDAEGCLTGVGGYVTAATCAPSGQLATRTLGNGVTQTMSYDADRLWLNSDTVTTSGGTTLQSETYGHNLRGQVSSKTSSDTADRWTYGYDGLGRLTSATNKTKSAWSVSVGLDKVGRITSMTGAGSYTYPSVNTTKPDHAPSKVGSVNYTYDLNGNRTSDGTTTSVYNNQNRLASTTTGGVTTTYSYDAFGERVKVGDTTTISIGGRQIMRINGTTKEKYYYYGSERIASKDHNTNAVHYYISDQLGSAHLILDANATVVKRTVYKPFGTVADQSGSYTSPFALAGGETDGSGLTHLGARYYDPAIGQFTSPDPSGAANPARPQSLNRFTYADNDPVNLVDPSGYMAVPAGWPTGIPARYKASPIRVVYNPVLNRLGVEVDAKIGGKGMEFTYTHDFDAADMSSFNLRIANPNPFVPDFNIASQWNDEQRGLRIGFTKGGGFKDADGRANAVGLAVGASLSFSANARTGEFKVSSAYGFQVGNNIKLPAKVGRLQFAKVTTLYSSKPDGQGTNGQAISGNGKTSTNGAGTVSGGATYTSTSSVSQSMINGVQYDLFPAHAAGGAFNYGTDRMYSPQGVNNYANGVSVNLNNAAVIRSIESQPHHVLRLY